MTGIYAIYKPVGPTSHDLINQLRQITGEKRIGHAGTLDPRASGVLVVGVGREATRKLAEIVKKEKEYLATVCLGQQSTTDDGEGEKTTRTTLTIPTLEEVQAAVLSFTGEILQVPPAYSAVKIKGQAAYKLARKGQAPPLKPRPIVIKQIEILDYRWPRLKLRVVTGPGVYIRALARDLGQKLGTGAYLEELERTRVGDFTKEKALSIERLARDWLLMMKKKGVKPPPTRVTS